MTQTSIRLSIEGINAEEHFRIINLLTDGGTDVRSGVTIDSTIEAVPASGGELTPTTGAVWVDVLPKFGLNRPAEVPLGKAVERIDQLPSNTVTLIVADDYETALAAWHRIIDLVGGVEQKSLANGRESVRRVNGSIVVPTSPGRYRDRPHVADLMLVVGDEYSDELAGLLLEQSLKRAPWLMSLGAEI